MNQKETIRDFTQEEKELIVKTPITIDCFDMSNCFDIRFEEEDDCYGMLNEQWDRTIYICGLLQEKYNETKDERYFIELVRLLPNSYKVVKL